MQATAVGTAVTNRIEITPKTLVAKLLQPLIRSQLPKQTQEAFAALRALAEKSS